MFRLRQLATRAALPAASRGLAAGPAGSLYSWGMGTGGVLGHLGGEKSGLQQQYVELAPRAVETLSGGVAVTGLAAGASHSALVTDDGRLFTWGDGKHGKLGHGDEEARQVPVEVAGLQGVKVVAASCGSFHTAALDDEGRLYTCGWGGSFFGGAGALGLGGSSTVLEPAHVEALTTDGFLVGSMSSGEQHMMALSRSGELWAWGKGEYGLLGNGDNSDEKEPVPIEAFMDKTVTKVAAGNSFTVAVDSEGALYSWGRNDQGQLGLGGGFSMEVYALENYPRLVEGFEGMKVVDAAAGHAHAAAVTEDGSLWVWGSKLWLEPHKITTLGEQPVTRVTCGLNATLATTADGALYSFGKGRSYCLGHGDKKTRQLPERVEALHGAIVSDVCAGDRHVLALVSE